VKPRRFMAAVLLAGAAVGFGCSYKLVRKGRLNGPLADEIRQKVSQRRGLEFRRPVEVRVVSRSETHELLEEELRERLPVEKAEKLQRAYVRMGLIDPGADIRKIMLDFYTSNLAGFYSPRTEKLYLVREIARKFSFIEFILQRDLNGEIMLAHELTHALDDQHYDLEAMEKRREHNDDALLALNALEEGTAMLVSFSVLYRPRAGMEEVIKVMERHNERLRKLISVAAGDVPVVLADSVAFAYISGSGFVGYLYKKYGGWDKVNSAYLRPPASTEEISFPEKYLDKSDPPSEIALLVVPKAFGKSWISLDTNTLGQVGVSALLRRFIPSARATEAAEGWGGDRYAVVGTSDGKRTMWIWVTDWDTSEDAGEFHAAYRDLLSVKYENLHEIECPSSLGDDRCFTSASGEIMRLALSGRRVSVIEGADENTLPAAVRCADGLIAAEDAPVESKPRPGVDATVDFP